MTSLEISQRGIFSKKTWKRIIISILFLVIFEYILFPAPVLANEENFANDGNIDEVIDPAQLKTLPLNDINDYEVARMEYRTATAYTSEINQCDGNPCRTASGFNLCKNDSENVVAANFLPFGTRVRLPDIFGDRVFVVRDRMSADNGDKIDVWFRNKQDALKFGVKYVKIEILSDIEP